ncbi:MAG: NfeD family protein [Anaerolineales bacterium]
MEFLIDPNVAYVILLVGIFLGFLALVTPGTGLLEIGAFFCFVLAGYAIYNLTINWWALGILLLSIVPFLYAIQKPKREVFLGISIVLLVVGSIFLFASKDHWLSVNPVVAITSSGALSVFLWIAMRKSMDVLAHRPAHDLDALVGKDGEARSRVWDDGSVYVSGEMWSARSDQEIPVGSHIRVIRREGFILVVEKV